ncbi:hypothetical protein RJ639_021036, partial [Escallonia herrerae]
INGPRVCDAWAVLSQADVFSFVVLVLLSCKWSQEQLFSYQGECRGPPKLCKCDSPRCITATLYIYNRAWKYWSEGAGSSSSLIDPASRAHSGSTRDIVRCIHIGLLCLRENVAYRPTMASVILMLNSFSIALLVPLEPAFFMHGSIDPEFPLCKYSSGLMTPINQ